MCALTPLPESGHGDLNVVQEPNKAGLNGQINIPKGALCLGGQDLIARKGEPLLGPPDQPYLISYS